MTNDIHRNTPQQGATAYLCPQHETEALASKQWANKLIQRSIAYFGLSLSTDVEHHVFYYDCIQTQQRCQEVGIASIFIKIKASVYEGD